MSSVRWIPWIGSWASWTSCWVVWGYVNAMTWTNDSTWICPGCAQSLDHPGTWVLVSTSPIAGTIQIIQRYTYLFILVQHSEIDVVHILLPIHLADHHWCSSGLHSSLHFQLRSLEQVMQHRSTGLHTGQLLLMKFLEYLVQPFSINNDVYQSVAECRCSSSTPLGGPPFQFLQQPNCSAPSRLRWSCWIRIHLIHHGQQNTYNEDDHDEVDPCQRMEGQHGIVHGFRPTDSGGRSKHLEEGVHNVVAMIWGFMCDTNSK